ncbi:CobW/HypB/UreG, nucleotide-binding domain-containing protein [Aspergillus bertholletiae]|uniref:CobW/HypB/UreG, nucleotide-binding domain-containing protein n=1 Tax=Aspergillus bertholletiae TaxID=1226010 RepID=A0A5N7BND1_9EURO|nr:CobW/HypB/UreG, nucleotide-binding domain-containing protein [Aspergillus bertholletiae]
MSFPYKHFLLIGATSGIGRAMADRLIESGAKVTAVGRRQDRLDEFVRQHGEDKASAIAFDISKTDQAPQFAKDAFTAHPDIDCVFLNAGVQRRHDLTSQETFKLDEFLNEVHVDFTSVVALAHAFLPYLTAKTEPVSFIFTGTNLAIVPACPMPAYSAAKAALNVFILCFREQLKSTNIKVIELSPPAVQKVGRKVGMPMDQFINEAFAGFQEGKDQVVVGSVADEKTFHEVLNKRRTMFENLSKKEKKKMSPIPITIVTGFLGSGKTTLLLNLIPQLPKNYRLALLKNEFGDVAIDSQLASTQSISGVRELLNGCICCNLVGQLSDALNQLREEVKPDRIVIETSGSAFPATLAMEVNRLEREQPGSFVLDGVISVIDVENWEGYEDTSYTAKLQAKYTDLIIFNKWEKVSERRYDLCLDRVGDLEVQTPCVKSDKGRVDKDVLLGIDGALFAKDDGAGLADGHHGHDHDHGHKHDHQSEVEVLSVTLKSAQPEPTVDASALEQLLLSAPKDEVYRIKGIMRCSTQSPPAESSDALNEPRPVAPQDGTTRHYILNWAFGRWTFTPSDVVAETADPGVAARITFILARYESGKWKKKLEAGGLVQTGEGNEGVELVVERLV